MIRYLQTEGVHVICTYLKVHMQSALLPVLNLRLVKSNGVWMCGYSLVVALINCLLSNHMVFVHPASAPASKLSFLKVRRIVDVWRILRLIELVTI